MGYPEGLLKSRAIIKSGEYAVIPPEGRVANVLPGFNGCDFTILASPKMGASLVFYVATILSGSSTTEPFADEADLESFIYVMEGDKSLEVSSGAARQKLTTGGYLYSTPGDGLAFTSLADLPIRILLYKQRYIKHPSTDLPETVSGSVTDLEVTVYDNMGNAVIQDLLPSDLRYDMNMNVLSFEPAGSHLFVETHVQEHGA